MRGGVERITDVVVEFVPGDRLLAERIAGAVWEHLSIPPLMVLPGIDQDPDQFAEAMRKWRPVMAVPEWAEAEVKAEALREAAAALDPALTYPGYEGLLCADATDYLRDRADALSASTGDERLPGRDQDANAAQGQPAGSEGHVGTFPPSDLGPFWNEMNASVDWVKDWVDEAARKQGIEDEGDRT